MAIQIIIQDQKPELIFQNPSKALVIDYKILQGDKGEPGDVANIGYHESEFDHGTLHSHANKGLLDTLSLDESGFLLVDGDPANTFSIGVASTTIDYVGTDNATGYVITYSLNLADNVLKIIETRTYNPAA